MLRTAKEAAVIWCPMVRMSDIAHERDNRAARCNADKCAMWRWVGITQQAIGEPPQFMHAFQPPRGYCGLAGKPE